MNDQQKQIYRCILLQTMKDFIKLCEENDIKYVAAYGTVLGAVRHKGLIPWDDDIDVYMTRDNYEKLISLKDKIEKTSYEIIDYNNTNYYLPFAKFCNKQTTLWEMEDYPFILGVFVDIFPLDYVPEGDNDAINLKYKYKKYWIQYRRCLRKISKNQYLNNIHHHSLRLVLVGLRNKIYQPFKRFFISRFIKTEHLIKEKNGNRYMCYTTSAQPIDKATYPKHWIENTIKVPFEDFLINIPQDYHNYLTNEYGDYMKLPPIGMRISNHFHYFIDLNQRLTIDEIRSLKRNEKHQSK